MDQTNESVKPSRRAFLKKFGMTLGAVGVVGALGVLNSCSTKEAGKKFRFINAKGEYETPFDRTSKTW